MKKRITEQQLEGLSDQALTRLTNYYGRCRDDADLQTCILWGRRGRGRVVPQFNVGDMLEFLEEECGITPTLLPGPASEWCDMLWSIVKSQLEKEEHS